MFVCVARAHIYMPNMQSLPSGLHEQSHDCEHSFVSPVYLSSLPTKKSTLQQGHRHHFTFTESDWGGSGSTAEPTDLYESSLHSDAKHLICSSVYLLYVCVHMCTCTCAYYKLLSAALHCKLSGLTPVQDLLSCDMLSQPFARASQTFLSCRSVICCAVSWQSRSEFVILTWVKDQCCACFYDSVIKLKANSAESSLQQWGCAVMEVSQTTAAEAVGGERRETTVIYFSAFFFWFSFKKLES